MNFSSREICQIDVEIQQGFLTSESQIIIIIFKSPIGYRFTEKWVKVYIRITSSLFAQFT